MLDITTKYDIIKIQRKQLNNKTARSADGSSWAGSFGVVYRLAGACWTVLIRPAPILRVPGTQKNFFAFFAFQGLTAYPGSGITQLQGNDKASPKGDKIMTKDKFIRIHENRGYHVEKVGRMVFLTMGNYTAIWFFNEDGTLDENNKPFWKLEKGG